MEVPLIFILSSIMLLPLAQGNPNSNEIQTHIAYTRPIPLAPGSVSNAFHRLPMPKGPIAVSRFQADVVERDNDTGEMIPVLLSDAYLHHHVVGSGGAFGSQANSKNKWTPMKPQNFSRAVGFGAGTESRGTPQAFSFPYAFVTVEGEEFWIANVHIINTRSLAQDVAYRCLECPCTVENRQDMDASWSSLDLSSSLTKNRNTSTVNPQCNAELQTSKNSACFHQTYHGGLRCCKNGVSCLAQNEVAENPTTISTYYLRYRFEYLSLSNSSLSNPMIKPISVASCCDATGDLEHHGAVEYDLPRCDPEQHPGCVYSLSTRQTIDALSGQSVYSRLDGPGASADPGGEWIELVFAVGHQHRSGMGIYLYNDTTDELICGSIPTYGNGMGIGHERGYITAMSTCTFDPPLITRRDTVVKIVSHYNNTLAHTGVMSLFYLAIAELEPPLSNALELSHVTPFGPLSEDGLGWLVVAVVIMIAGIGAIAHHVRRHGRRRNYEQVVH